MMRRKMDPILHIPRVPMRKGVVTRRTTTKVRMKMMTKKKRKRQKMRKRMKM
jgi:hypothetical protein